MHLLYLKYNSRLFTLVVLGTFVFIILLYLLIFQTTYLFQMRVAITDITVVAWGFFHWNRKKMGDNKKVKRVEGIDNMTNLPDRSSFLKELQIRERIAQAQKYGDFFSLIYLNIDNFRSYNQKKGKDAEEALLQRMAHLLLQNVRGGDLVFRYGWDEFMVLIPGLGKEVSARIAIRLKALVENEFINEGITVSGAVISYEPGKNTLKKIEETMFMAKTAGKNRVYTAE